MDSKGMSGTPARWQEVASNCSSLTCSPVPLQWQSQKGNLAAAAAAVGAVSSPSTPDK